MKKLISLLSLSLIVLLSSHAQATESFISLRDLEIYDHHPTAKSLSTQLEDFARQQIPELNDQSLISIRPQNDLISGKSISFALFFLKNKKSDRPQSLLINISSDLSADKNKMVSPTITKKTLLSQTQFSVQVSLLDLTARISDSLSGNAFVYPLGGSAFDEGILPRSKGKTIFASPAFVGSMPKTAAIESRKAPAYYGGKPFLRIVPGNSNESLYGFHTTPFDYIDKHKPAENLARGFVSAGCLRLKDDDLIELYQIIAYGAQKAVPVVIKYKTEETSAHPYPIIKNGYHSVTGYCWKVGEGSSPCLPEYKPGARPVFSTAWVEKDPSNIIKKLFDYGKAQVTAIGFEY